jgi:hypothetical protein
MPRHFVRDEAADHRLYLEDELLMLRHFVQDKAPEHWLFLEDKL